MKIQMKVIAIACALSVGGCADMTETQQGTAKGAAIGAGAGALLGAVAGGSRKSATVGAAVGAAGGAIAGNVWSKKMQQQRQQMEAATAGTGVNVTRTEDNRLKLEIPSDISFDTGRADIKPDFRPILDAFAAGLKDNPSSTVTIVGHTDSTGGDAINNPLSINRAASTRDYLTVRGVELNRIRVDGHGSREPIATNDTPENRARNRRVEIFVAEPDAGAY